MAPASEHRLMTKLFKFLYYLIQDIPWCQERLATAVSTFQE